MRSIGLASGLCVLVIASLGSAPGPFTARLPMAITGSGQGPDALTVSRLSTRLKLVHTFDNHLTPDRLVGIRTLVLVLGASASGRDHAGIDTELTRVNALLSMAKDLGIAVIAVHLGGESRRGALSDRFIDPVVARADYLIVTEEGNRDGLFTQVSKARRVPLVIVEQSDEVGQELKAVLAQ